MNNDMSRAGLIRHPEIFSFLIHTTHLHRDTGFPVHCKVSNAQAAMNAKGGMRWCAE